MGFFNGLHRPRQHSWATTGLWSTGRPDENLQITCPSCGNWSNQSKNNLLQELGSAHSRSRVSRSSLSSNAMRAHARSCSKKSWNVEGDQRISNEICFSYGTGGKETLRKGISTREEETRGRRTLFWNSFVRREKQSSPPLVQRPLMNNLDSNKLLSKTNFCRIYQSKNPAIMSRNSSTASLGMLSWHTTWNLRS